MKLYTITASGDDQARVTFQVEATAIRSAIEVWARLYAPGNPPVTVEVVGSEVDELPVPRHNVLVVTPMEGLRNCWCFYGAVESKMITGEIVLTA